MSAAGVGPIVPALGRLNARGYVQILEDNLVPYTEQVAPQGEEVNFVHDHATIHDAHVVQNFFDDHPNIIRMDWPRKFMDCNPIENLFGHIVLEWENRNERRQADLQAHVLQVWDSLRATPEVCQRLVGSMPVRLREVIQAAGDMTRF